MEFLRILAASILDLVSAFFTAPVLIVAAAAAVILICENRKYKAGAYYQVTKLPYLSVRNDLGRYGEYLTYKQLRGFEKAGARFLFNLYLPKENGETSEIDVLMISANGVFVFESKNYSGWIFGSETRTQWYQTLPSGRGNSHKESFYNPILQNRSHIKYLRPLIGEELPVWSVIVFSDRCTLKKIDLLSEDIPVINRSDVAETVYGICRKSTAAPLRKADVEALYDRLYVYTQVDAAVRAKYIEDIRRDTDAYSGKAAGRAPQPEVAAPSCAARPEEEPRPKAAAVPSFAAPSEEEQPPAAAAAQPAAPARAGVGCEQRPAKCPLCGGDLVLRTASRGKNAGNQFYGCSNYPKCRFIQPIQ